MRKPWRMVGAAGLCLLLCAACRSHKAEVKDLPKPDGKKMSVMGTGRDSHGCAGAAGYVWSEMLQDCIRILDRGVGLKDVARPDEVLGAYAVFAPDSSRVEVYLPSGSRPLLLEREDDQWVSGAYRLHRPAEGRWQLSQDGNPLYSE